MENTNIEKLAVSLVETSKEITGLEGKISEAVAQMQTELELRQKTANELKETIKLAMIENNVKKFENDIVSFTYVAPTTRTALDTTRLKEEKPDLWEEYSKTSEVKDSVRIKIKDNV